jgi:hypothetical protein
MTRRRLLGLGAALLTSAVIGCGGTTQEPAAAENDPTAGEDATKKMQGMLGSPTVKTKKK